MTKNFQITSGKVILIYGSLREPRTKVYNMPHQEENATNLSCTKRKNAQGMFSEIPLLILGQVCAIRGMHYAT